MPLLSLSETSNHSGCLRILGFSGNSSDRRSCFNLQPDLLHLTNFQKLVSVKEEISLECRYASQEELLRI